VVDQVARQVERDHQPGDEAYLLRPLHRLAVYPRRRAGFATAARIGELAAMRMPYVTAALAAILLTLPALASSGVSDERVSLPDGPGSIGGIGENADIDPNMGMMRTSVPFEVPAGRAGLTPDLRLAYSSGGGASVVGIGWSFSTPSIERTSLRGLPRYDATDEFAADGGDELVLVDPATSTYRARFEKVFARYRWRDVGAGDQGYWTKEEPDGRVHYYGADDTGTLVPTARVAGSDGTFRYHLVATVDPYGHAVRYAYTQDGGTSLLDRVDYLFDDDGNARFSVVLTYQDRPDWISDCIPGTNVLLRKRLSGVVVLSDAGSGGTPIRRLFLRYEDDDASGGASRLADVTTFGVDDEAFPGVFSFGYSASLTGSCAGTCDRPYAVDMGTLPGGAVLQNGRATLLDINGDALPDVLHTPAGGGHEWIFSSLDSDGKPQFASSAIASTANVGTGFVLDAPSVQVLDVDGDGFTDIVAGTTGQVRCNDGSGDWNGSACLMNATLPVLEADDTGDADPRFVRFFDYDNDKRIDVLRTSSGTTEVLHNTTAGFISTAVDDIGSVFDTDPLHLADMNGDGLQDPAELLPGGSVRYRLNLGYGRWTDWTTVTLTGMSGVDPTLMELEDINGDGLSDVVAIVGLEVKYAVNRNGDRFDAARTLTSADVDGGLPNRDTGTQVLFADMNGSGTRDIVWFQPDGSTTFVELFPVRPNLLTRVENGLGRVQVIEYDTSVQQQRLSGRAWQYKLPHPMNVVVGTDSWVTLTGGEDGAGLHEEVRFSYFDGFYDGEDHRFRGFGEVHLTRLAESSRDSQASSRVSMLFDVGAADTYRNGLMVERLTEQDDAGTWVSVRTERTEYADCDVDGVPTSGLSFPVRFVCETASETTHQDGAPAADWLTTRVEQTWDGYGNVVARHEHGVVFAGDPASPGGCASCSHEAGEFGEPCGAMCLGDERVTETDYVVPGADTSDGWFLRAPTSERMYAASGGMQSETRTYYDGPDFVGLPLGELTAGTPTRVETLVEAGRYLQTSRVALDAHGNSVEELDALGDAEDTSGHRRAIDYDARGFKVTAVRVLMTSAEGAPYALERVASYDPVFNQLASMTNWRVVEGGATTTDEATSRFAYDAFGRAAAVALPEDAADDPSLTYSYELADPVSRVVTRRRSQATGEHDLVRARCVDGLGRLVQQRTLVADGDVLVSGFVEYNRRGNEVRGYQAYTDTTLDCAQAPPSGVLYTDTSYDAVGRVLGNVLPDDGIYDGASLTRIEYTPLAKRTWDAEDSDADSPHFDTFDTVRYDGLGRTVEVTRALGDDAGVWRVGYDGLGNLASVSDPAGNRKVQAWDLAGRALEVRDPNAGDFAFAYDDEGNLLTRTDARGATTAVEYDGLNRPLRKLDPDDAAATEVTFAYDLPSTCDDCGYPAGRLTSVTWPLGADLSGDGRDVIERDQRGRTVATTRTLHGHDFRVERSYDFADREVMTRYPDGGELARAYDGADRLTAITDVIEGISYEARGLVSSTTYANGAETTRTWDARERLSALRTELGGEALVDLTMTHDRVGNVLSVADSGEGAMAQDLGVTFVHDDWYRVTSATFADEDVGYGFDLLSNVIERTSSVASSAQHLGDLDYDASRPSAVSQAGDLAYEYDEAGNVTSRGSSTLSWDYQGRLSALEADSTHAYAYGPSETRVARRDSDGLTIYVAPDFEVRDGVAVTYARTGRTRVARLDNPDFQVELLEDGNGSGGIDAGDAWLAGGLAQEELLFAAARRLVTPEVATTYLFEDHLGSLIVAASSDGEVLGRQSFTLDGAVRASAGYVDRYGFTGQEHDASGFVHYRFRSLDPHSGRWLSVDPAFLVLDAESLDRPGEATGGYTYVAGQASTMVDEHGLRRRRGKGGGGGGGGGGGATVNNNNNNNNNKGASKTKNKRRRNRGKKKAGGGNNNNNNGGGGDAAASGKLDWKAVVPKKGAYKGQDRETHVGLHNVDNTSKPKHGVFSSDGVALTNEAWGKAVASGQKPSGKGVFVVNMGRNVGRAGGSSAQGKPAQNYTKIKIVVQPGTSNIITAFPVQ
jgi:RHS repeat-associated protein